MNKSPLKNSQDDLNCYVKRFMKMTQALSYIRKEFPDGTETFSYSYNDAPGQNETQISREEYKAVRGKTEWLLDLKKIEFSDMDINQLKVDVRKIFQIILETSIIEKFGVHGKFAGSEINGAAKLRSVSTKSKEKKSVLVEKELEFELKGYTTFTGQFSFNNIAVKSKESWENDSVTVSNYLLDNKIFELIQALPENASVGDSGVFMEIKDHIDQAKKTWRLEYRYKTIYLVINESVSQGQRDLSYSATDLYELDLEGNFYHYQTRLEFSNGDNLLLNPTNMLSFSNTP